MWSEKTDSQASMIVLHVSVIGTAIVNETPDNAPECKELGEAAAKA